MLICELFSGKLYDLGLAGFPVGSPFVAEKAVPAYEPTCAVSERRAKSPLRSYFNPCKHDSLGVFLHGRILTLASFAAMVSSKVAPSVRSRRHSVLSEIHHRHSRQATLYPALSRIQVLSQAIVIMPDRGISPRTWVSTVIGSVASCH